MLALALLSYGASVAVGGNGFVAAFVGGILFGAATKRRLTEPTEFAENVGLFSSFLVWALFGAFIAGPALRDGFDGHAIAYALLSLTVVRMAPVALALFGTKWRSDTVAFVGWFGPRGLASVVFLLITIQDLHETAITAPVAAVTWTILLSSIGAANGSILTSPRIYFAQARDGLFFKRLARIHPRFETPSFAILVQGAWAALLAASGSYELAGAPELRVRRRDLSQREVGAEAQRS